MYMPKKTFALVAAALLVTLSATPSRSDTASDARLSDTVSVLEGDHQLSLPKGTTVKILQKQGDSAVVSLSLPDGTPLITHISLSKISSAQAVVAASSSPAPQNTTAFSVKKPSPSQPGGTTPADNPSVEAPAVNSSDNSTSNATPPDPSDAEGRSDQPHPHYSETLASLNTTLPLPKYTALHGFFYVVIKGAAIPVVYSLPMEDQHLAKTASHLVLYCPYGGENPSLDGGLPQKIVENLGCSVFSFSVGSQDSDVYQVRKAYASPEWFQAVLDARSAIIKGFGLERKKLIVFGYSAGGGRALDFTGAFPNEVEAVAAQGAASAPRTTIPDYNSVKWLIVNNRGEPNAGTTRPFYQKLASQGCSALYAETSAEGGNYHGNTAQDDELIYTYIQGILGQRSLAAEGINDMARLWPYATPKNPLDRYALTKTSFLNEDDISSGKFDFLPTGAFALAWSKICPPTQTIRAEDGLQNIHVTFPAAQKPLGTIIYYDTVTVTNVTRKVEDINSLAELGCVVISPAKRTTAQDFALSVSNWLKEQGSYISGIHILGYGANGASFVAKISTSNNLPVKSINLVDFDNSTIDDETKTAIENEAKTCGSYSFLAYLNSKTSTDLTTVATDLVTDSSQSRGCSKFLITPSVTDNTLAADASKISDDKSVFQADGNLLAIAQEGSIGKDQNAVQDQVGAGQEQLEWDREQIEADVTRETKDQAEAIVERKRAEDQVLSLVTYRMAAFH